MCKCLTARGTHKRARMSCKSARVRGNRRPLSPMLVGGEVVSLRPDSGQPAPDWHRAFASVSGPSRTWPSSAPVCARRMHGRWRESTIKRSLNPRTRRRQGFVGAEESAHPSRPHLGFYPPLFCSLLVGLKHGIYSKHPPPQPNRLTPDHKLITKA